MINNITLKIKRHYDTLSKYYLKLWDGHLHHGYFESNESRHLATQKLVDYLIDKTGVIKGSSVLDIGCGMGKTSVYLAEEYGCKVTGITISPVQKKMAEDAAKSVKPHPTFKVMDANYLDIRKKYDLIWSVEMISHLTNREYFFKKVSSLMNGKWCMALWIKGKDGPHIPIIEKGMLVHLPTINEYTRHFKRNNLKVVFKKDISEKVAKTWSISIRLVWNRHWWRFVFKHGFLKFLRSFKAMKKGYISGELKYLVIVVEKELSK